MKIHLVRHGRTIDQPNFNQKLNQPDPALNETGKTQAELLGRRLQGCPIEAIYSSDLLRTQQTAQIVNRYTQTGITLRPQLREIDMGDVFSKGWGAFPEYYREWVKHESDLPYPNGESGQNVKVRVWEVIDEILETHDHSVVVVTHGGVIMVLVSACLGMGLENRFLFSPMDNCSLTTLSYDRESSKIQVEKVNDTAHLEFSEWRY